MREPENNFLYAPTYDPPPLKTCGSRALVDAYAVATGSHLSSHRGIQWDLRYQRVKALQQEEWRALWKLTSRVPAAQIIADDPSSAATSPDDLSRAAGESAALGEGAAEEVQTNNADDGTAVVRAAVQTEMKFHCSQCGKAYRQQKAAEEHVALRHNDAAGAKVLEGPGPGEVLVVVTNAAAGGGAAPSLKKSASMSAAPTATPSPSGESTTPVKATPEGAARSLKRRLASVQPPTHRAKSAGGGPGRALSIREMSKMYSNPFGAAAEAAAEAAKAEENEPVNPFVGGQREEVSPSDGGTAISASSSSSSSCAAQRVDHPLSSIVRSSEKKPRLPSGVLPFAYQLFTCPLCTASSAFSCRLLDRLMDHLEEEHAEEGGVDALPPETLARLYDQQRHPWKYVASTQEKTTKVGADSSPPQATHPAEQTPATQAQQKQKKDKAEVLTSSSSSSSSHNTIPTTGADGAAMGNSTTLLQEEAQRGGDDDDDEEERKRKKAAMMREEVVRLHSRVASNILLRGEVSDVQHGYFGKQLVLQYVVRVIGQEAAGGEQQQQQRAAEEIEYVVVRYQGEPASFTALKASIHTGSDVVVMGNLRLDRRLDPISKRRHAYPVVIVAPPYGSIRALQ